MSAKKSKNSFKQGSSISKILILIITILSIIGIVLLLRPSIEIKVQTFSVFSLLVFSMIAVIGLIFSIISRNNTVRNCFPNRIDDGFEKTIQALNVDSFKRTMLLTDFLMNLRYMDASAKRNLRLHDVTNIIVITLSAIVPVLINYSYNDKAIVDKPVIMLATVFSVILAIVNAFRQSYKFREKWQNYRRTCEILIIEGQNYFALSGSYKSFANHNDAFANFINSISVILVDQINDYIKVSAPESDKVIREGIEDNFKKIAEQLARKQSDFNKKLINEEINQLVRNIPEISYHEIDHDRKLIKLYINDSTYQPLEKIQFKNTSLSEFSYKVVSNQAEIKTQSLVTPSAGIKNAEMPNREFGSVGCLCLQVDKIVFVTCYHVVKHINNAWNLFVPGSNDNVITPDNKIIGKIIQGEKTLFVDNAIVAIDEETFFNPLATKQIKLKQDIIYLEEENFKSYENVFIISRIRQGKMIAGKLSEINKPVSINYGTDTDKDFKNLEGLLLIHHVSTEPFSLSGDSGSVVFTAKGEVIGIVVAGDGYRSSFAIPFSTVSDRFNLSIL